jgi:preprotein translocase subunit SecG
MGTVLLVLQVLAALVFVILMAVQTDKAEQSGVMGLGGQGGRMMGSIDMPVGAERILKPLSKWVAVGFLFVSALAAINGESGGKMAWWALPVAAVLYVIVMLFGNRLWDGFVHLFGADS